MRVYIRRDNDGDLSLELEATAGSYSPDIFCDLAARAFELWHWIAGEAAEVEEHG